MSVSARCIAIGVLVFLYWVAAFAAALIDVFADVKQIDAGGWWNAAWLRDPGGRLGERVLKLLEMVPGWDYGHWPFFLALILTAAGFGTGAWLLSALVSGWWLRRTRSGQSKVP